MTDAPVLDYDVAIADHTASLHSMLPSSQTVARTVALTRFLAQVQDRSAKADLLFLEAWEMRPGRHLGATLRAQQLRRANPTLAAEIRAELTLD